MTTVKEDQVSRDAAAAYLRHDLVVVTDLIEHLDWRVTHKQVAAFLREIGAELLGQKRLDDGRKSVWAIRNVSKWRGSTEGQIRDAYRDMGEPTLSEAERDSLVGRIETVFDKGRGGWTARWVRRWNSVWTPTRRRPRRAFAERNW